MHSDTQGHSIRSPDGKASMFGQAANVTSWGSVRLIGEYIRTGFLVTNFRQEV